MSRSRRKHPCISIGGGSDKSDKEGKRFCNKIFRKLSKRGLIDEKYMPFRTREAMDNYGFSSDGLAIWDNKLDKKFMRK